MMLNKASAHLYTLGNNIYTRKNSPTNIYLFIVNNSNIRKRCEIHTKLRIKTPEPLLLTMNIFHIFSSVCIEFKQVSVCGSHPINLKTLKLLTTEITNRYTKILVKLQLIKKDCDPK